MKRLLLVVMTMVLVGCSQSNVLVGSEWELTRINGEGVVDDSRVSLSFDEDQLGGNSGCNSYFADYALSGRNGIKIGETGMTLMACLDSELMSQEMRYTSFLSRVSEYSLDGDELVLVGEGGEMEFRQVRRSR